MRKKLKEAPEEKVFETDAPGGSESELRKMGHQDPP